MAQDQTVGSGRKTFSKKMETHYHFQISKRSDSVPSKLKNLFIHFTQERGSPNFTSKFIYFSIRLLSVELHGPGFDWVVAQAKWSGIPWAKRKRRVFCLLDYSFQLQLFFDSTSILPSRKANLKYMVFWTTVSIYFIPILGFKWGVGVWGKGVHGTHKRRQPPHFIPYLTIKCDCNAVFLFAHQGLAHIQNILSKILKGNCCNC